MPVIKRIRGGYRRFSRLLTAIAIAIPLLLAAILSPARYALAAENATTAATAGDDENIQFSMPTKIPFALKADGSVIAPTDWAMTIGQGSPLVKVSGFHIDGFPAGVTISGETDTCATWSNRGHETPEGDGRFVLTGDGGGKVTATGGTDDDPICWGYGLTRLGKNDIAWNLTGVDGNRGLLDGAANGETGVGTVSITVEAVKPQTFAIISDDGQMNFYHRVRVPSVGEEYDGLKIKHIYAGLDDLAIEKTTADWFAETDAPWYEERNEPTSVKVVDDGVAVGVLRYLFQNCENIKTIDLYKLERPTSGIMSLFHMFSGCSSLVDLRLPEWGFKGCNNLDGTFSKCSSIETIDLSGIYRTVTATCWAFNGCSRLREIKGIEHITSDGLYRIEHCFYNCSSLEKLDLSGWTTKRVIEYDENAHNETFCTRHGTFYGCTRLRIIKLGPDFSFGSDIHDSDCYLPVPSPDSIDGADGKWYAASDGKGYAPKDMPTGKADTYYAVAPMSFAVFSSDDGSFNYYHRAGRPVKGDEWGGKKVDGVYSGFEDKRYRTTSATSNDIDTMTTPWNDVSQNVLTVSVIDEGIKPISIAYWFQFFRNCTSINVNRLDLSNCDSTQHCFAYCYSATDVKVDKLDVSNITEMDSTFKHMYSLELIDLSRWDTSKVNNMHELFMNDYKLREIKFGEKWTTGKVHDFVEMFLACHELKLDCSNWDVSWTNYNIKPDQSHGDVITRGNSRFNSEAPGVVLPAPWVPTAFAVYSEDDGGLNFYKQEKRLLPVVGGTYDGRSVSSVYTGFEEDEYTGTWPNDNCPWFPIASEVKKVAVIDTIKPKSIAWWFNQFVACESFDLGNIDTSECVSFKRLFSSDKTCTALLGLDKWDTGKVQSLDACFDGMHMTEISGISGWNTSSCKSFDSAFFNCTELRKLDISGWSNESVVVGPKGYEYILFGHSGGGYRNLEYVKIGAKWNHVGDLLMNTSTFMKVTGADGNWYALSDGIGYSSSNVPNNKADTYYTTKALLEQAKLS